MRRTSYSAVIGKLLDVKRFADEIGFSITRKNEKLQDALLVIAAYEPSLRNSAWKRLYSKTGGECVPRNRTVRKSI